MRVLSTKVFSVFLRNLRKKTCRDGAKSHRLPSLRLESREKQRRRNQRRQNARFFPLIFRAPKMFRKVIDGEKFEFLAGTLSPQGELFEIYFVRLIGTPNQQFKNGCQLRLAS